MKSIGVFCGSSSGTDPIYIEAARETGRLTAQRGIEIVFGGGRVGLMGAVADAALGEGGHVTGVMPKALVDREIAHESLTEMHVVKNMHERKMKMAELSSGFVALPGGAGTLEEIFEQWTWAQLGIHDKACGFLNVGGYFDPLKEMAARMVDKGFMKGRYADMLIFTEDPGGLLDSFETYTPPAPKWQAAPDEPAVEP